MADGINRTEAAEFDQPSAAVGAFLEEQGAENIHIKLMERRRSTGRRSKRRAAQAKTIRRLETPGALEKTSS